MLPCSTLKTSDALCGQAWIESLSTTMANSTIGQSITWGGSFSVGRICTSDGSTAPPEGPQSAQGSGAVGQECTCQSALLLSALEEADSDYVYPAFKGNLRLLPGTAPFLSVRAQKRRCIYSSVPSCIA